MSFWSKLHAAAYPFLLCVVGVGSFVIGALPKRTNEGKEAYTALQAELEASQKRQKDFQESCRGMNCDALFASEAAGVITAAYMDEYTPVVRLQDKCLYDARLSIGTNFPNATLFEFGQIDAPNGVGKAYLMHCSWLVPSRVWCPSK